ncbi:peptidase M20 [Acuticoccus sediminis]|uniref:Peptidase M20 n=1 Tax=Acuticoccus sediminis TaxID=2184697 RepID=A0A8B2NEX3_9HYPH|nr:amidohydrolase [Acuticoccus sediminis]RAH97338.1 peptidase M20 [Acuticoccus sediminis]
MSEHNGLRQKVIGWVAEHAGALSRDHQEIWSYAEPSWREYRSAAWYVERLKAEGFEVEEASGDMPTAFVARWGKGGPQIAAHAEYDAVPGTSQAVAPHREARPGSTYWDAGHTDPHSALGIGALGGVLAAKAVMEENGIEGRIAFFGEPAEKVCGSKVIHAARGYYDSLDAMISFHPSYLGGLTNTVILETHCGCYWSKLYTFETVDAETWGASRSGNVAYNTAAVARAPGANDALCLMYTTTKYTRPSMLTNSGLWTLNEAIHGAGDATADNHPPRASQIQYAWRCPTMEMAAEIERVLDANAEHVAGITHTSLHVDVISKTRFGIANRVLAEATFRAFEFAGAPTWGEESLEFAREIQAGLGLEPMDAPLVDGLERLMEPAEAEADIRRGLLPTQKNYTSDDYIEYTWHCPTVRLFVGRPMLKSPGPGYRYPDWVRNAMGGHAPTIDPMMLKASEVVGLTMLDLMLSPETVAAARREFNERTGGGIGGSDWVAPLLAPDFPPPIGYRWPSYVDTPTGPQWYAPRPFDERERPFRRNAG